MCKEKKGVYVRELGYGKGPAGEPNFRHSNLNGMFRGNIRNEVIPCNVISMTQFHPEFFSVLRLPIVIKMSSASSKTDLKSFCLCT